MLGQLALQVACLVLGDDVLAAQTVQKLLYLRKGCSSFGLIGHFSDATYHGARSLGPVTVLDSSLLRLTDSLLR